ncbi:MAG: AMP-binding protein [Deltaproteobacteria bacterium]|nr:AMP-binding protein [Deltaproteobacteria bacterium]
MAQTHRPRPDNSAPEKLSREYLSLGVWQPYSLSDCWDHNAHRDPKGMAVSDGERALSWAESKTWTDRVALGLIKLGVARDAVLLAQLPNCLEVVLIRVACEKAGVLCLPAPRTWRKKELGYTLGYTKAQAVVVPAQYRDVDYFGMIRELQAGSPQLRHVLLPAKEVPQGARSLAELASFPREEKISRAALERRRYRATEVSLVNATTGSTGLPKFAEYAAAARLLYGRAYINNMRLTHDDVLAALSPAAAGPNIPIYFAAPQVGAKVVVLGHFEARAAFELIEQEKVTIACGVPAQFAMMVREPHLDHFNLSSVRFWLSVGAPLPSTLAREIEEKLGGIVLNCYGAADWGGVVFTSPDDPPEARYFTVGKPWVGTEVRIVDEEGRACGAREVGGLEGRGPACSFGYYRDPEATRAAWRSDGWMGLGDLACWGQGGNVIVVGRKRDTIIRGGQNIEPSEIENYLLDHPKVQQVAVVGVPDPIMGERVCVYVVPRPNEGVTLEEIGSFLASKQIAPYKIPERLVVAEKLPMLADTKVDRSALKAAIAGTRVRKP